MKRFLILFFIFPILLFAQESNGGVKLLLSGYKNTVYEEEFDLYSRYFRVSKNMSFLAFDYIFEDTSFVSEIMDFKQYKKWRKESLREKKQTNKWDKNFDGNIVNYFSCHYKDEKETFLLFVWVLNTGESVGVVSTSYNPKFIVR